MLVDNINMHLKNKRGKGSRTVFMLFSAGLGSGSFEHSNKFEVS
jgi:hypothetical protein